MEQKLSRLSEIILTDEQKSVMDLVREGVDDGIQVQTVGGFAGTGKTVLVSKLAWELYGFAVCAFTGKAANVLRQKNVNAQTIHSLIYFPEGKDKNGKTTWRLKTQAEMERSCGDAVDGFLVDEASMISKELHEALTSYRLPVVFFGDHGQLPPVGSNDVYLMKEPDFRLETIHRNAGPLAYFAEHLRNSESSWSWVSPFDFIRVLSRHQATDDMLTGADQIICPDNTTRVFQNNKVRELQGRKGLLENGERVICLRNSRPWRLFNGMQGIVDNVRLPEAGQSTVGVFDFADDAGVLHRDVPFNTEQFGKKKYEYEMDTGSHPFDYAYAITCHKAQGSEWPNVLVFDQQWEGSYWEPSRWRYTAASRARSSITWLH